MNADLESVHSSFGSTTNPRVNLGAESSFPPTIEASGMGGEGVGGGQRVQVRPGSHSAVSSPNSSPGASAARMDAARGLGVALPSDSTSLDHAHTLPMQPSYRPGHNTVLNTQSSDTSVNSQTELVGREGGSQRSSLAVGGGAGEEDNGDEHEEAFLALLYDPAYIIIIMCSQFIRELSC